MISVFHAIILGIVQGLTEFLPISSSGHLLVIPYIFKWAYQGKAFDVALHAGTVVALLIYFWKDWLTIIKNGFAKKPVVTNSAWPYSQNFLWQIVVASIPAAIFGLAIDKLMGKWSDEHVTAAIILTAINFIVFGWLLWYMDKESDSNTTPAAMTYKKAFIVGLFQSIALIPGVSRSGITLTGSRLVGLAREEAARFSFLLGTPAIIGALLVELPKIIHEGLGLSFWLGVITAAIFGIAAIKFLMGYLKKSDFSLFVWYRVAVAVIVIAVLIVRL